MSYPVGTELRFSAIFRDADGAEADPTAITFRIKPSGGTEVLFTYGVDVSLVKNNVGRYSILYAPSAAGTWSARWKGTGAVVAASADLQVRVLATALTP